jgi:hypothetical protein
VVTDLLLLHDYISYYYTHSAPTDTDSQNCLNRALIQKDLNNSTEMGDPCTTVGRHSQFHKP